MIRNNAVGASRNDVDFVCRISAAQPIRIAENLCRPKHVEGPHWRNGHDEDPKCASAHGTFICVIAPYVFSGWLAYGHSQDYETTTHFKLSLKTTDV
jgi:hypothetical protein